MKASPRVQAYFAALKERTKKAHELAEKARANHYDPADHVEVMLAENLAERVVGIIAAVAPQVKNTGIAQRILQLEAQYGALDWRVAMHIAHEVAQQKYCVFKNEQEAMEVGIRVGFAYVTLGVVSAPLEGFVRLELKRRRDGSGNYFSLVFAGPIRAAGGTAASVGVLIADYVRKNMGYATYDPDEKEIDRTFAEIEDYHEWVTNLQYFPSKEETAFMTHNCPVEISGDETEKYEISNINLKDLPRVPQNRIRGGFCLIHSSCLELKAPKLWKNLSVWGTEMGMEHWNFLEEFVALQKKMRSKGKESGQSTGITPDYTYIKDLVAGRPVFGYPLRPGGFRLRYGRGRLSGFSAQSIHPATMIATNGFIATGTQLKVERPGKAAAMTVCDSIEGPIVRLRNGNVLQLRTEEEAKSHAPHIAKVLFLGDVLINHGDFFDRAHPLVPAGYCQEWWIQEVKEQLKEPTPQALASSTGISHELAEHLLKLPLTTRITHKDAWAISTHLHVPLHPDHTYYYSLLTQEQLHRLRTWLTSNLLPDGTIHTDSEKQLLERIGCPHTAGQGTLRLSEQDAHNLRTTLGIGTDSPAEGESVLAIINSISPVRIEDKAGTFIGARMGRPEKAKMRKLTGQPHGLFPVGNEGGRLRSIQSTLEKGLVTSSFADFRCKTCKAQTIFPRCHACDSKDVEHIEPTPEANGRKPDMRRSIPIRDIFQSSLSKLNTKIYPDLIKGVRGTMHSKHIPEHLTKAILRAKHAINVNKDGTTRYDCSEIGITHFKPKEIRASIKKLQELGYTKDIHGTDLQDDSQILELLPQDVILPCCPEGSEEPADEIFYRITQFVDEELTKLYGMPSYYNLQNKNHLIGELVLGLAPHTSSAILGRVIGFSKTQAFLAHPYFHAAMRRDADGDESCLFLLMDAFLNFSKLYLPESRGSNMDAPLVLTYLLNPAEVDDMAFNIDTAWNYPKELYQAAQQYKKPWEVSIPKIADVLGTEKQFEGMGFTHDTDNFNAGILCSAYKTLPSMQEKLDAQMHVARKVSAVDESDVARLVLEKHFLRDIRGNLRKYSQQEVRCVDCNEKFRRPPLKGRCTACNGKLLFTISEGSITKYLQPALKLAEDYSVSSYLRQSMLIVERMITDNFGRAAEKQEGLGKFL
ncbi:MAG: DNA polymerase II large subunit [Nitrosarchaeum sp.]|nr:DNA polymerase II large subunit [Nitrosarchaeum sp.]